MRPCRVAKTGRGSVRLESGNLANAYGYDDAFRPDWGRFSASSEYGRRVARWSPTRVVGPA